MTRGRSGQHLQGRALFVGHLRHGLRQHVAGQVASLNLRSPGQVNYDPCALCRERPRPPETPVAPPPPTPSPEVGGLLSPSASPLHPGQALPRWRRICSDVEVESTLPSVRRSSTLHSMNVTARLPTRRRLASPAESRDAAMQHAERGCTNGNRRSSRSDRTTPVPA
jgi:hypothetical protein